MEFHNFCLFKLAQLEGRLLEDDFYETNKCTPCDGLNYDCACYEPTSDDVINFYLRN